MVFLTPVLDLQICNTTSSLTPCQNMGEKSTDLPSHRWHITATEPELEMFCLPVGLLVGPVLPMQNRDTRMTPMSALLRVPAIAL